MDQPSFLSRLLPARKDGGFAMPKDIVWGASPIVGEDGRYHLFASSWPKAQGMGAWLTHSQVVHAVSDTPEGPFAYQAVALPARGEGYWDGSMTHNPTIHKHGDTYLLYYTGSHYTHHDDPRENEIECFNNKRIGLAISKSVNGPWQRFDQPILEPRAGKWDSVITSNAAPCVLPDGRVLLVYKSTDVAQRERIERRKQGPFCGLRLGVAWAETPTGPYVSCSEEPLFEGTEWAVDMEDGYVWQQDGRFYMLAKIFGEGEQLIGERGAGFLAVSEDGNSWRPADPPQGYSRSVNWTDGTSTTFRRLERVQVLLQNGVPTHLYFAIDLATETGGEYHNICVPVSP